MNRMLKVFVILNICILLLYTNPKSAVPNLISYQARLTDNTGNVVADGTYQLAFSIFDNEVGGNLLWDETHIAVNFSDGSFTVCLGSITTLTDLVFTDSSRYLEISFNGETMTPRSRLLSVPYAMRAGSIDNATINGGLVITPDQFASLGNAITILDTNGNTSMTFTINSFGRGFIEFYDPIDSKGQTGMKAASQKVASLSSDGLTFFGATTADTNTQIFSNGDIISKGQITMGENSSGTTAWSTVFGFNNTAAGDSATIGGGSYNTASGIRATIGGGGNNNAFGGVSTIGGGAHNTIDSGAYTTIGGGHGNTIWGNLSTIGGGAQNRTNDSYATVSGGGSNSADNNGSTVGGGYSNTAGGWRSTIGGGTHDTASASHSTIGGGELNYIDVFGYHATIGGGEGNFAGATSAAISGGEFNTITSNAEFGVINGGRSNEVSGGSSVIGGGQLNSVSGNFAVLGGGHDNAAIGHNSTIAGGQHDTTSGLWATIVGGQKNYVSGDYSFIGAGQSNNVNGDWSSIGGGHLNTTTNYYSTIAGGHENNANGHGSFIGGGRLHIVSGDYATISGGYQNLASGHFAIASGYQAQALHYGSTVFFSRDPSNPSDSLMSGGIGQFALGAKGCFYFSNSPGTATYDTTKLINTSSGAYLTTGGVWTNSSDENLKENFASIDEQEILSKISELDIYQWNYITEDDNKLHIGPTAQDFHELFGLGNDDKSISTIDPSGVALVAIKALAEKNRKLEDELSELKKLVNELLK